MTTRIYIVEAIVECKAGESALVEASSASQALRHATKNAFSVRVATTLEVARMVGAGCKVEKAGEVEEEANPQGE